MRQFAWSLLLFAFGPASFAQLDGMPFPVEAYNEREAFFLLLPASKHHCAETVERSGFHAWTYLTVSPTKLPEGYEEFQIEVSVCDRAQRCASYRQVKANRSQLNRLNISEGLVEYACYLKRSEVIDSVKIRLWTSTPWYISKTLIDAGQIRAADLRSNNQILLPTQGGKSEFKIQVH